MKVEEGRSRVIIERMSPEIDGGAFPIKRIVGDRVVVEVTAFTDGHDAISAVLLYQHGQEPNWCETPMLPLGNDRWRAEFVVSTMGPYHYTVMAWVDHFKSWSRDFAKRAAAGQALTVDAQIGQQWVEAAVKRATGGDAAALQSYAEQLRGNEAQSTQAAAAPALADLMYRYAERFCPSVYSPELSVTVDRERARFSSWYEFFPRSCAFEPDKHGTFKDVEARLSYIADMGFDVLYLPPIHPIGRSFRKGRNNNVVAQPGEPGSPWAIGSSEGGHKSIHPELGTLEDFQHLVQAANGKGIDIALDLAFQCAPDHPYVTEHPQWFRARPDGTIQYAENPPKKYQDIYPFDFETDDWQALWEELRSVVQYWVDQGVRVFRVDNPHTKSFNFWQWLIPSIKANYPDVLFLAEAFTRPHLLYRLAKVGFTQSYNYFPWRNTKGELTHYLTELSQTEVREYCCANLWPNTPDILAEILQHGGRAAFMSRLVLAATLGTSYGIYGPAFELCDNVPIALGKEEYLNSEKYEIKRWNWDSKDNLRPLIARVNQIRRENLAFKSNDGLRFHQTENEQLLAYSKSNADGSNQLLIVVNLDTRYTQAGFVNLALDQLNLDPTQAYQVHDLLSDARYLWQGSRNYVELNPQVMPAHIFAIRRKVRTEQDFDYYL